MLTIWPFTDNSSARLVSVQALPEGAICAWDPGAAGMSSDLGIASDQMVSLARERSRQIGLLAAFRQGLQQRNLLAAMQQGRRAAIPALVEATRAPVRTLQDTYPTYLPRSVMITTSSPSSAAYSASERDACESLMVFTAEPPRRRCESRCDP